jgi:hypothetical protein
MSAIPPPPPSCPPGEIWSNSSCILELPPLPPVPPPPPPAPPRLYFLLSNKLATTESVFHGSFFAQRIKPYEITENGSSVTITSYLKLPEGNSRKSFNSVGILSNVELVDGKPSMLEDVMLSNRLYIERNDDIKVGSIIYDSTGVDFRVISVNFSEDNYSIDVTSSQSVFEGSSFIFNNKKCSIINKATPAVEKIAPLLIEQAVDSAIIDDKNRVKITITIS